MSAITLTTTETYDFIRINDLITSALEGGSNYWYTIIDHNRKEVGSEFICGTPFKEGGYIDFTAYEYDDDSVYRLDLKAIKLGIEIFKTEYPSYYKDWINENDDAMTGDIFLQCCLFNKVIFG